MQLGYAPPPLLHSLNCKPYAPVLLLIQPLWLRFSSFPPAFSKLEVAVCANGEPLLEFGLLNPKTLGDGFCSDAGVFCLVSNSF
jgi:hypothetical protein